MNVNGIERRLELIEAQLGDDDALTPVQQAKLDRWLALAAALEATMAPEHAAGVARVWDARARGEFAPTDDRYPVWAGWSHLADQARHLLDLAYRNGFPLRLALPPIVGDLLLASNYWLDARCRGCLLLLPYSHEHWRGGVYVPTSYPLSPCPDWGGEVGPRPRPLPRNHIPGDDAGARDAGRPREAAPVSMDDPFGTAEPSTDPR
jgi:hypothetical protein